MAIAGSMMLMPGLGKVPQAQKLDVDDQGRAIGMDYRRRVEYLIKQYALEPGALEIQYIEEYFGEFPRRKTADEIITRLRDRESLILMAEAPLPDDPSGALVPVSYKIVHEIRADESDPEAARSRRSSRRRRRPSTGRRILYSWIGGTRRDWRGQGHFRALTEESEVWAMGAGFEEVVVKTKNRYYDMRAVLAQLQFNVVKHEPHPKDSAESKVYLSKLLPAELARAPPQRPHRRLRRVIKPSSRQALKPEGYSAFNVTTGSTRVPRRAGRYDATIATAASITADAR